MTRAAPKRSRLFLPAVAAGLGAAVIAISGNPFAVQAQDAPPPPAAAEQTAPVTSAEQPPPDPAAELAKKRDETRAELDKLSKTINLSSDKVSELQSSIDNLEKSTASIRQALIDSAARRKGLEGKILDSEKKLA